jgi:glycosyltransferase involved in cell wall biosynthesis
VVISGPPFSQFLLAPLARLRPGTAVVLDYRDEWTTYRASYEMTSRIAAHAGDALEPLLLRRAHAVTTATEAFRSALLSRFKFLSPDVVHTIPNGWDADDLPRVAPEPPADRFVATYAGTVFRLTSARSLLSAVRRLHEREPDLGRLLELRFLGRIVDTERHAFEGMDALGVRRLGYVPHEQMLSELLASHLVLCLLDDVPGAERIYPAKVFEIMRLARPCLTLAPPGALAELVTRHRVGEVVPPRHEVAIAEALARRLREFRDGHYVSWSRPVDVERYDRRVLAEKFAVIMRQAHQVARSR